MPHLPAHLGPDLGGKPHCSHGPGVHKVGLADDLRHPAKLYDVVTLLWVGG